MTGIRLVSWLWRPVGGVREIGWGDVLLAGALSLWAVRLVSRVPAAGHSAGQAAGPLAGGVLAAVAVLAMTVPVVWERRAPAGAAVAVAVGAVLNELVIGPMVRCGPAIPAVLTIAFFAGARLERPRLAIAAAFCFGALTTQAFYDPRLGPGFLVAGLPLAAGFCLAGMLVRSRSRAVAALRVRNAELREQREQTARLAVAADRAQVAADLEEFLGDRITAMGVTAEAGRDLIEADQPGAADAFAAIQTSGRATLARMRDVVGALRDDPRTEPQPVLARLGHLLEHATSADVRLQVDGDRRALPAGVELSAFRIVENLLAALQDTPATRIDVRVSFEADALELRVAGPANRHANSAAVVVAARQWAALIGGTLHVDTGSSRCDAHARLPLTAGYASA